MIFVDPDGRSPDWYPEYDSETGQINLVAEAGDNEASLRQWANGAFSDAEVSILYNSLTEEGRIDMSGTFIGDFVQGFVADGEGGCQFNCFSSVESGLGGKDISNGWGESNQRQFEIFVSENGLTESPANPETLGKAQPFKSAFGYTIPGTEGELDHVSVFAGRDSSGTPWVLTKNGYRSENADGTLSDDNRYKFQKGVTFVGFNGSLQPDKVYQRQ